jgi:hypothetical protein
MSDQEQPTVLADLKGAVSEWVQARNELTPQERKEVHLRALMELFPANLGSFAAEEYCGALAKRKEKTIDETLCYLNSRLLALEQHQVTLVQTGYFASGDFICLFEDIWRRIFTTAQQAKLQALRGALLTLITNLPSFHIDKKDLFVKSLDAMGDIHIYILQLFYERFDRPGLGAFMEVQELYRLLGIATESDRHVAYGALDVFANKRYIEHGNVPQLEEGRIDTLRQRFKLTPLGCEFLTFVRNEDIPHKANPLASD